MGQKHYPIPYAWKKLTAYVAICVVLFGLHQAGIYFFVSKWFSHACAMVLLGFFAILIFRVEKNEFEKIPYLNKLVR